MDIGTPNIPFLVGHIYGRGIFCALFTGLVVGIFPLGFIYGIENGLPVVAWMGF